MRLHRFIYNFSFSNQKVFIKEGNFVHQIKNVLRLKKGNCLILVNPKLNVEALFEIVKIELNSVHLRFIKVLDLMKKKNNNEISLFLAVLKKENFELACQKVTEIGIKRIIPLLTERTVKMNIPQKRVLKIIKEASEQAGRLDLPILENVTEFNDIFSLNFLKSSLNLAFHPTGEDIKNFMGAKINEFQNNNVSIFIGPEGGFTEKEIETFKENNFYIISLGKNVLRAETAAIVGSYLMFLFSK